MSDELNERILRHLADKDYQPKKIRALAREMGLAEDQHYDTFRQALKALQHAGRIVVGKDSAVTLPQIGGQVVGVYRGTSRGFGFVEPTTPNSHGDLFVPEGEARDAITGDTVLARVLKRGKRAGKMIHHGRVVEVLERGHSRFVGTLTQVRRRWCVVPDGTILDQPIFTQDVTAKNARQGDKVVVEIMTYPSQRTEATGVIAEVLGQAGKPDVDLLGIVRQFHIPDQFEQQTLEDARHVTAGFDPTRAAEDRLDLCDLAMITIDPVTARDFDDAISVEILDDGRFELGVHIADVGYFVQPGSPLDEEARLRGNSVYFPNHVIPMLPEVLSNGLCSLQEGQARLTKSAFVTYDEAGRPVKERFANSVIRSSKRLTYEQATQILNGKVGGHARKVVDLVRRADQLARNIRARRLREGMLVLDLPEIELELDEAGRPVDVHPADRSFSHTIIEMFMVEANEAVARLLDRLNWPFLRRIHPEPEPASLKAMAQFLGALGLAVPRNPNRHTLQKLLDSTRGKPEAFAIHLAVLRSLQQAEYSPKHIGHYALASEHYCHFTSPIRRYPDLIVHRLLAAHLQSPAKRKRKKPPQLVEGDDLPEVGKHCSFTERRAEDAGRELQTIYILRMLSDRIGEELDGIVTGVANFGVFAQLRRYLIDGLVRMEGLGDDWWEVDSRRGCVIGQRSGRKIQIGDPVRVKIILADVTSRRLDLALIEHNPRGRGAKVSKSTRKKGTRGRSGQRKPK